MSSEKFNLPKTQDIKRVIYQMAVRHTASIEMYWFSDESTVSKGGICSIYSIFNGVQLINHSCAPNLHHYIDDNNTLHCVVVRPIEKGEQVFINYLSQCGESIDRGSALKEGWDFNCRCEKCIQSSSNNSDEDKEKDPAFRSIKKKFSIRTIKDVKHMRKECVNFLRQFGRNWSSSVEMVVNCLIFVINKL